MSRKTAIALTSCALILPALSYSSHSVASTVTPPLMLANVYHSGIDVSQYWASEKLDGVRAFWDGHQLRSRSGRPLFAPKWFIAALPDEAIEGELWLGRGKFAEMSGLEHAADPNDPRWQHVRYMLFDMPKSTVSFKTRMAKLQRLAQRINQPWLQALPHRQFNDETALLAYLDNLVKAGAEGVMLNRSASRYQARRTDDLLKLKKYQDAEAKVIAYLPGKGKYQGMVGALLLAMPDGRHFAVGSGLSDDQRRQPPALGSIVTYRYNGLTAHGLPRFARFMRQQPAH